MEQGTSNRALSGLLARLGGGRTGGQDAARTAAQPAGQSGLSSAAAAGPAGSEKSISTKAFSRFLAALKYREAPVLLDLGPVVGSNINYFGERLGCKFFIEDVYANLEKYARENRTRELAEFFKTRFPQPDDSFDGILCWDIFDYLDKASAQVLAREMTRLLKPGGALLTFFATVAIPGKEYTRYLVVDDKTFRHKSAPAARGRQQVFVNRDINLMFQGLNVSDSFLLMTRTREIVFRKPEQRSAVGENHGLPESASVETTSTNGKTMTTTSTVTAMPAPTTTTVTPMGAKAAMSASSASSIGGSSIGGAAIGRRS